MVALYFKEASEPESAFWQLDATVNKNVITTIWKGRVTGEYNFRLATITSMGVTSPITIEDGDRHYYGQPTEEVPVSVHVDNSWYSKYIYCKSICWWCFNLYQRQHLRILYFKILFEN